MKRTLSYLPFLLIGLCVFLTYSPILTHQFAFDDLPLLVENPFVQNWENIRRLFSHDYITPHSEANLFIIHDVGSGEATYRPVFTFYLLVLFRWLGLNPFGWHAISLVLHTINAWMAYILVRRLANPEAALIAALLFAVHPINAEAVNCIAFQNKLLTCLFSLCALHQTLKDKTVSSLLFFALAIFTSEIGAVTALVAVFLKKERRLGLFAGYCAVFLFYLLTAAWIKNSPMPFPTHFFKHWDTGAVAGPGLGYLLSTPIKVAGNYLRWMLFASPNYPSMPFLDEIDGWKGWKADGFFWACLALLLATFAFWCWARKRHKPAADGIAFFFIALLPTHLVCYDAYACRYLYFASVGYFMAVGYFFSQALLSTWKRLVWPLVFSAVILAIPLTQSNSIPWINNLTLWHSTLEYAGKNHLPLIYNTLGLVYLQQGRTSEALPYLKQGVRLDRSKAPWAELGVAYGSRGDWASAKHFFKKELLRSPKSAITWVNLGCVHREEKNNSAALRCFKNAVTIDPRYANAWLNLSKMYRTMGNLRDARRSLNRFRALSQSVVAPD